MNKIFVAGFAVFMMFFGAGNIILPLMLAQNYYNHWLAPFIGFCITGVMITFLGLVASFVSDGTKNFFTPLGVKFGLLMQVILVCIEGPFGIVPRSMIISYGSVSSIIPSCTNFIFYTLFSLSLYFMVNNRKNIVPIIGKIVTPIMIIFLVAINITTYLQKGFDFVSFDFIFKDLNIGLELGYLTYDLPGAIYFASVTLSYLKSKSNQNALSYGIKASIVSAIFLILVYASFIYLGLAHYEFIKDSTPENILPQIVKGSLGGSYQIIFIIIVIIACMTTAAAAITIWVDFLMQYIGNKFNWNRNILLSLSLVVAFVVSLGDFMQLMSFLLPLLQIIYPIMILLTIYNLVNNFKKLYI